MTEAPKATTRGPGIVALLPEQGLLSQYIQAGPWEGPTTQSYAPTIVGNTAQAVNYNASALVRGNT